ISFAMTSFAIGAFFYIMHNQCIDFSVLENYNPGKPTVLLDDEGNEWARFQLDRREPITLSQMPPHLIQAFIAAEDWSFFNHSGISWRGIIRSTLVNVYHGRKMQGASTITQQLVKMLFFNSKKTFERKVKEQLYAVFIERQFTKETILQTYLNHIYFGCGIYGVQAASQRFWGIDAAAISIEQAALLAGIVRSPASYCPILSLQSAQKRRNVILHSMRKLSCITDQEYEQAKQVPVVIKENDQSLLAPHLRESIRLFLENTVGKDRVYSGGLIVQTTLNRQTQLQAEKVFKAQCAHLKTSIMPEIDGALISMEVKTGGIKALIGGYDFNSSKFNRALQAKRQIGSIFKPLIYAAAMQDGMSFADTQVDEPFELTQTNGALWAPQNYNNQFNGEVTLAYALSHSSNIVAIKTLLAVGADPIIKLAKACHMSGSFHPYPSLALGCVDTTLLEVTGMFNIFANCGVYIEPHYVKWVKDGWGTKIWKAAVQKNQVITSRVNSQVAQVLTLALDRVKKIWKHDWVSCAALSKTGTTNDSRMCWYAGSTPELTTVVYIGCDDNKSMGHNIYPLRTALPIWMGLNSALPCKQKTFSFDSSLERIIINEKTGKRLYSADYADAISILI
ncbi:MAG: transglycosylase domain-containing protein, partial [Candidatus Babeliales bacterium]|nr:transglycosylase domain-containing protein [Candidatus Babeliales bacterium]